MGQLDTVKNTLRLPDFKEQLEAALPANITPDKFIRATITVLSANPKLANDQASLFSAVLQAASLGLMPDTQLGEAYIVPYRNKASLQIGLQGLVQLAWRNQAIRSINSGVVCANDTIHELDEVRGELRYSRCMEGDRGPVQFVWCLIETTRGGSQLEVMSRAEIESIRKGAPSANSPAWKSYWTEMARKVVMKRALKKLPKSAELQRAIAIDDSIYEERDMGPADVVAPRSSRLDALKQAEEVDEPKMEIQPDPSTAIDENELLL